MRRTLAAGLAGILAATAILPSGETRSAYPAPPTVTIEYHVDDVAWRFKPLVNDTHRVVTELFAQYGIRAERGAYRALPGHFRIDLLSDTSYEKVLAPEIAREPLAKATIGYALHGKDRALLRIGEFYDSIDTCPGRAVAGTAELITHEIGHLLGLTHMETKEQGSDTVNLMDDTYDLNQSERLCGRLPSTIRSSDLDVSLTTEQTAIIRDASLGGMVWVTLHSTPDFDIYIALRNRFARQEGTPQTSEGTVTIEILDGDTP